jgi:hypothetical protein
MGIKLSNNAFATLAASITSSATSITLTTGQGARFPSLGAGDYFYATLVDTSNNLEIVKCTARSTDVLTVVRAQESTTARAYNTGDRIEIRITAQTFIDAVAEIGPTQISDKANTSTGYMVMPTGTTAQRPGSPTTGMYRMNSTSGTPEWYDPVSSTWIKFNQGNPYSVEYLVVAGGGGGGGHNAGGGGGGGVLASTASVTGGLNYTITVGGGGAGGSNTPGVSGSNSVLSTFATAIGGGFGNSGSGTPSTNGGSGGSGGGAGASFAGGAGTAGQGFAGGSGVNPGGGGGGGAAAVGGSGSGNGGFPGGAGVLNAINGSSLYWAGGGGGGGYTQNAGNGGIGGGGGGGCRGGGTGGSGGGSAINNGSAGVGPDDPVFVAGNGGSGIVIIRYLGSQKGAGGTVTSSGGYTIHTFTSSGTFTA